MNEQRNSCLIRNASVIAGFAILMSGCLEKEEAATGVNRAPSISGSPVGSVAAGSSYSFTPSATDPEGDALTFAITAMPSWASFDSATGHLSGTPAESNVGSYQNIVISVSDGEFSTSLPAFATTVSSSVTNSSPQISGTPATSINVGDIYTFTPTASDPDGDTLSFSITGLPSWASFDAANGRVSGTPQSGNVGTYSGIVISVSDGEFSTSLPAFEITVSSSVTNSSPQISGTPATSINVGDNYTFTPTASDPDGDTLSFSITGLPSWASFDAANGRVSGTPQSGNVSVYNNIAISVSDGQLNASLASFSITVNAISLGSVTLSWTPPTQNTDGTALTDLAGYKIYWGTSTGNYPDSVSINNASITTYLVENLAPGTYEFVATSFNDAGIESSYSNPATKIVQ